MWQKAIDQSPVNPGPNKAGVFVSGLGQWPTCGEWPTVRHGPGRGPSVIGRDKSAGPGEEDPGDGSMAPLSGAPGPPHRRWTLTGTVRQPKEGAVGKLEIPAVHLDVAFPAAFSLDHKFGPDRKTARKTV